MMPWHGGVTLTALSEPSLALLGAMMATIGTIWSILFVAYTFIYEHFDRHYPDLLEKLKMHLKYGPPDGEDRSYWTKEANEIITRMGRYEVVFDAYLAAGALSFASIILSGYTMAYDLPDLVWGSGVLFVIALVSLAAALSYEIWSSRRSIAKRRSDLEELLRHD